MENDPGIHEKGALTANSGWIAALEVLLLLALFVIVGIRLVPAHWTSIWMDREFTGWTAPIAQRVAHGQVLYADGAHTPMPPLSFILLWAIHGSRVAWIDESRLNFLFQCGMLLVGYLVLSKWFSKPVPVTATVAAAGYVFALPKTILYDAMAQFLVAICIGIISGILYRYFLELQPLSRAYLSGLGVGLAALTLTKQNTALGVTVTAIVALALLPIGGLTKRITALLWVFAGMGVGLVALTALIAPQISLPGMLQDVFLRSAEPKGGMPRLVMNLSAYAPEFLRMIAPGGACIALAAGFWWWCGRRPPESAMQQPDVVSSRLGAITLPLLACSVVMGLTVHLVWRLEAAGRLMMSTAFALATLVIAGALLKLRGNHLRGFGFLTLVALGGAVAHNLSVDYLRLTYDNNPVILLALGAFLQATAVLIQHCQVVPAAVRTFAIATVCAAVVLVSMAVLRPQIKIAGQCTAAWTEVPYLRGARLRPEAAGMRSLVGLVRSATTPSDTVLLLPEDPDVEAWWDRRRPNLSSAIIFTDQYWPRFVKTDFQRLTERPPKLIIVGPRNFWPVFSRRWAGADGLLIDRVLNELVPRRYKQIDAHPIQYGGKADFMDVYLLQ